MTESLDNYTIRDALLALGFKDITSQNRSTKTWRLHHPLMRHWVSIKLAEQVERRMSKAPLVLHPEDAHRVQSTAKAQAGITFESKPYRGSSAKYNSVPGVALSLANLAALNEFVEAATGRRSASPVDETAGVPLAQSPSERVDPQASNIDPFLLAAAEAEVDADLSSASVSRTTRQQLIEARLGQGRFREDMLKIWDNRCAVTGCSIVRALVASHAIAWREDKSPQVRLDPHNGLLLTASIDKLFDLGLISFADDGRLLHRPTLSASDLSLLGVPNGARLRFVHSRHRPYLAAHRTRHGF